MWRSLTTWSRKRRMRMFSTNTPWCLSTSAKTVWNNSTEESYLIFNIKSVVLIHVTICFSAHSMIVFVKIISSFKLKFCQNNNSNFDPRYQSFQVAPEGIKAGFETTRCSAALTNLINLTSIWCWSDKI